MYRIFSFVVFSLVSQLLFAQTSTVSGRVLDQQSGEAIEYATISVFAASNAELLNGTISLESGKFELSVKAADSIYITAQFLGYLTYTSEPIKPTSSIALGDISLNVNNNTLDEVLVEGRTVTSAFKLDKQVYDADQFQNAKGGTASDVLRNLPSITINSFGEISVRGTTGFQVMINGKPVQGDPSVILQQLSANSIEDVEVVTAPSAKYDPDGNAGIINIKTRQAVSDGLFLVANVLAGLPSIEPYDNKASAQRYGADITLNRKQGKWDFSGGLDYRRYDISGRREGYVNTYVNEILTEFPSDGERSFDEINYSARASVAYTPNPRQTITAGFFAGKRTKDRTADILYLNQQRSRITRDNFTGTESYYDLYRESNSPIAVNRPISRTTFFNENLRVRRSDFAIGSIDFNHEFSDKSSLKLSGLYERTVLGGPTYNASLAYPNTSEVLQQQFNENTNPLDGVRLQADYTRVIDDQKWESGYQYRYLQHPGDFDYFDYDLENNVLLVNPIFTNGINLSREIHSVYTQLSGSKDKLQYSAGLRMEYFDRTVDIDSPDETFDLEKFNLFPSVNFAYAVTEGLTLKTGYSTRIERTTTFKMTPFPEREHSETLEQGDAELLPEYINMGEVGLVQQWGDHSAFVTGYYRHTQNVINRVNTVFNDTILNRIYTNVGVSEAIGVEAGGTFFPTKNWRVYLGGNVFNYRINGELFSETVNTSNTVFSINANTNYDFTPTFTAQLAFNYLSERITAQGRDSEFYNPSLTLRKTFKDKRFAIALQWQNIDMGLWNANEQRITTAQNQFYTTTNYVYEVDIIQLNFTYQLNQSSRKVNLPDSEFGKKEF